MILARAEVVKSIKIVVARHNKERQERAAAWDMVSCATAFFTQANTELKRGI